MAQPPKSVVSLGEGTMALLVGILLVGGVCVARSARAANLYVRTVGTDSNDGSTPARALRSVTHAAALAKPGDRIVVGPGTYTEGNITPAAFARVSFVADRRGLLVGEPPDDVVIDATGFAAGFVLNHNLAVRIDGFVIYGAGNGVYVKSQSDQAVITNNIVSNNTSNGIFIQDSRGAVVFNNLVYNNASSGILVGGNVNGSPAVWVINNTVYKNANRGIFFTGTTIGSSGGLVLNNVTLDNNQAGIQVNQISRDGYLSAGNVFADHPASGTPLDVTDRRDDPAFVDPAGADGRLGGPDYGDDDFHLSQRAAGQALTSSAVDAGTDLARRLRLLHGTTRTDGRPDTGWVDAGYHYGNVDAVPPRPQLSIRYAPLFVNPTRGADANSGRSPSQALQSLAHAADLARPGDHIWLQPGVYAEGDLTFTNAGTAGRPILIQGMPGARIDATGFARGILLSARTAITLDSLDISGASNAGVEIRNNSTDIVVRRCRLHQNAERGLYVNGSFQILVRSSTVDHNAARGVQVDNGQVDISGSTIAANALQGLWAIDNALVSVSASDITDNLKSGVLTEHSEMTIGDTRITGGSDGAARFTLGSTGTLTRVTVSNSPDAGIQGISSVVTVSDSVVQNNTRVGIEGIVDSATLGSNELTIARTRACSNQGPGVHASDSALTMTDVTLCNNAAEGLQQVNGTLQATTATITQNAGVGLSLTGLDSATLTNGEVSHNGDTGVQSLSSTVTIAGTRVCDNQGPGIRAQDSTLVLTSPTVCSNIQDGVRQNGGRVQIAGGAVTQNHGRGLSLIGVESAALENVEISNNGDSGLQGLSSTVTVSGGSVESNTGPGIDSVVDATSHGASQLTVTGTRVCNNQGPGIHAQDATLMLSSATVCSNAQEGVRQGGGSAQIAGSSMTQNHAGGLLLAEVGSADLKNVEVSDNGDTGLLGLSSTVTITGGNIEHNGGPGIDAVVDTANGGASELTVTGTRVCSNQGPGVHAQDSAVTLGSATVCSNTQDGVRQSGGSVQIAGMRATQNLGAGIATTGTTEFALQNSTVDANHDNGVQVVTSATVSIAGSVVFSNQGDGITVLDAPAPMLWNNLVYGNGSTGMLISGDSVGSPNAQVLNNTIYGSGNRGLVIGGSNDKPPSAGALVLRNVFQGNATAGLQVNELSLPGYSGDYNLSTDPYGALTHPGTHDLFTDPLFIAPVAPSADFHLSQRLAGQQATSPAVDAGDIDVIAAGLQGTSTRTDGVADTGVVDLGFHYPALIGTPTRTPTGATATPTATRTPLPPTPTPTGAPTTATAVQTPTSTTTPLPPTPTETSVSTATDTPEIPTFTPTSTPEDTPTSPVPTDTPVTS